jgi:hypothetical protein
MRIAVHLDGFAVSVAVAQPRTIPSATMATRRGTHRVR